ncbi:MAG: hypothetical protein ACR2RF_32125 [Geminicoccaceae bacterium]
MARRIIEALHYGLGLSQRQIASRFPRLSPASISNYLEHGEPLEPEPLLSVGPPNDRLFKQGKCLICEIPLFGGEPITRDYCGECDPRGM